MSLYLPADTDAVRGAVVTANAANSPGYILDTDNSTDSASFTICVYWVQHINFNGFGAEHVLCEFTDGTNCCHVITVTHGRPGGTDLTFRWRMGTAKTVVGKVICTNDNNKAQVIWTLLASFRKDTVFASSDVALIVKKHGGSEKAWTATTFAKNDASDADMTDSATVVTTIANTRTTTCSLGKHLSGYTNSARGLIIAAIRNDVVRNGANGSVDAALIHGKVEPLQAFLYKPASVIYAVNHLLQGNPWNGTDLRIGGSNANMGVFDTFNSTQRGFFGRSSNTALTIVGSPTIVDAYSLGGATPSLMPRTAADSYNNLNIAAGLNSFRSEPQGTPTAKLAAFAGQCNSLSFERQWKVMVTANSRAVYSGTRNLVKTKAGVITDVTSAMNMNDSGWIGLVGPDNIVGYINHPPVCGVDGVSPGGSEASVSADRALGLDLLSTGATDQPLWADNAEVASNVATASRSCGQGSLSMMWSGGRQGGLSYNLTNFEYSGGANPRRLLPGYSYRILCRPVYSFVHTQPLTMKIRMLDIPTSSSIARTRKRGATSQGGADTLSASDETVPTMGSAGTAAKQITAVSGTFSWNTGTDLLPVNRYSLTVDDTDNGLANIVAGDIVELTNASGLVYSADGVPDVTIIHSITGKGTASCVVTPYNRFKVTGGTSVPAITDYLRCRSALDAIKTVTVNFAAGETASNIWRGMDVKAANDGKSGLVILGIDFYNPSKPGLIPCRFSQSGVGYRYQYARYHHTPHATDGRTWSQRCFAEMSPDVVIQSTANQGDGNSLSASSALLYYDWLASQVPKPELVTYATGPEIAQDGTATPNLLDADHPANFHCVFEHIYSLRTGLCNTAYGYDGVRAVANLVRYCSLAGYLTEDCGESATHPSGTPDLIRCINQIQNLATLAGVGVGGPNRLRARW